MVKLVRAWLFIFYIDKYQLDVNFQRQYLPSRESAYYTQALLEDTNQFQYFYLDRRLWRDI